MSMYLFYSIYEYKCILNVLLECIELFNTVYVVIFENNGKPKISKKYFRIITRFPVFEIFSSAIH